ALEAGAKVITADGVAVEDTPEGQLLRGMLDLFAQYERALIRARTRAALAVKRSKGEKYTPIRGKRRCRMHGGLSTGPRTAEGLARSRRARSKHGRFSVEARRAREEWVARDQAEMWRQYAPWAAENGFLIEPVRRRGFRGVRLSRPRGWAQELLRQ